MTRSIKKKFLHRLRYYIALFLLASQVAPACADVQINSDQLIINGKLTNDDADKVVDAFNQHQISVVVFQNSPGGEWRAGMRIGNFLAARNITTRIEGMCASSCTLAFLGGTRREIAEPAQRPILFFHAPYAQNQQKPLKTLLLPFLSWIESRTQSPLDPKFTEALSQSTSILAGVFFYFVYKPETEKNEWIAKICHGNESQIPLDCKQSDTLNIFSLGIAHK